MRYPSILAASLALAACQNGGTTPGSAPPAPASSTASNDTQDARPFEATEFARFNEPWAMSFLPDGRLLVTERAGKLRLFDPRTKKTGEISGIPKVAYGGQGGLGDVVLHPGFANNQLVYFSYAEAGDGGNRGAVVARAKLTSTGNGGTLSTPEVIWRQTPKVSGGGSSASANELKPAKAASTTVWMILRLMAASPVDLLI